MPMIFSQKANNRTLTIASVSAILFISMLNNIQTAVFEGFTHEGKTNEGTPSLAGVTRRLSSVIEMQSLSNGIKMQRNENGKWAQIILGLAKRHKGKLEKMPCGEETSCCG